jgi:hypothetical protein
VVTTLQEVVADPPARQVPPVALNVPLAPLLGAVKVTVAPATGFPFTSETLAIIAEANGAPMVVDSL